MSDEIERREPDANRNPYRQSIKRTSLSGSEFSLFTTKEILDTLEPFEKAQRAFFMSGNCGPDSPTDWPDHWKLHIETFSQGDMRHRPMEWMHQLTVGDFRRLAKLVDTIKGSIDNE